PDEMIAQRRQVNDAGEQENRECNEPVPNCECLLDVHSALTERQAVRPQQFLNFFPLPHGHESLRPTFGSSRRICGISSCTSDSGSRARVAGVDGFCRTPAGRCAIGSSCFSKCAGKFARNCSNAIKFDVLRKRLLSTSFLMFAISSTKIS